MKGAEVLTQWENYQNKDGECNPWSDHIVAKSNFDQKPKPTTPLSSRNSSFSTS